MSESHKLPSDLSDVVRRAIAEDVGSGDVTAGLIPPGTTARAILSVREDAVLCGTAWFDEVFAQLSRKVRVIWDKAEGEGILDGDRVCRIEGPAGAILTGERTALNFLQCLSGIATVARRYAAAVEGTPARVLDTRKTLPGLRLAQKYAVRCGGCANHRMGLYDAVLLKENHIVAAGSVSSAVSRARRSHPGLKIEVEVESLEELEQGLEAGADWIMLDNFAIEQIGPAVALAAGRAKLEISGNVDLDGVRSLARTGVDFISVGALTKHVRAIDFSLRFVDRDPDGGRPCPNESAREVY